jgi:hypothetical protein
MDVESDSSWPGVMKAIRECRGMSFLNEQQMRTFSTNILRMNGTELLAATARLHDEEVGLDLMGANNRDASSQAHRELKRHLHNFVTSAMTLVDHTRVMLNELYEGQPIHKEILRKITATVGSAPVCKFVQDMRNYMVHKGLPNSEMYFQGTNVDGKFIFKTGVRINKASLLEWSGWKALSKVYLEKVGDYVEIQEFTQKYLDEVNAFSSWLEEVLEAHHAFDISHLHELQLFHQPYPEERERQDTSESPDSAAGVSADRRQKVDSMAGSLFNKITQFELPSRNGGVTPFTTHRKVLTLTDQNDFKDVVVHDMDINGVPVVLFIHEAGISYGLSEVDMEQLRELFNAISAEPWVAQRFDCDFLTETFIFWARESRQTREAGLFLDFLQAKASKEVVMYEVYYPIAHFEVEHAFEFGEVIIEPLTGSFFNNVESKLSPAAAQGGHEFSKVMTQLRDRYEGFAAVKLKVEAHPSMIHKTSYSKAIDCVDLVRFFAPWSASALGRSPLALKGSEFTPSQNFIALSSTGFMSYEGVRPEFAACWRLPELGLEALINKGLGKASTLIDVFKLTEFEKKVRSGLILFSKGCTMASSADRLRYTLLAAEEVYLSHSQEHAESCVAKRISKLIRFEDVDQKAVYDSISKAYYVQGDVELVSPLTREALDIATLAIYQSILVALNNIDAFGDKKSFISALEAD